MHKAITNRHLYSVAPVCWSFSVVFDYSKRLLVSPSTLFSQILSLLRTRSMGTGPMRFASHTQSVCSRVAQHFFVSNTLFTVPSENNWFLKWFASFERRDLTRSGARNAFGNERYIDFNMINRIAIDLLASTVGKRQKPSEDWACINFSASAYCSHYSGVAICRPRRLSFYAP